MIVRVVDEDEVDAIEAEAFEAGLDRPEHAVPAEVPDPAMGRGDGEPLWVRVAAVVRGSNQRPTLVDTTNSSRG